MDLKNKEELSSSHQKNSYLDSNFCFNYHDFVHDDFFFFYEVKWSLMEYI